MKSGRPEGSKPRILVHSIWYYDNPQCPFYKRSADTVTQPSKKENCVEAIVVTFRLVTIVIQDALEVMFVNIVKYHGNVLFLQISKISRHFCRILGHRQ